MDDQFIFSEEEGSIEPEELVSWNILVVDDDADVHVATKLTLDKVTILGKPLNLIDVNSGREAIITLKANNQIDLILLDMIMESNQAGLDVANWLRHEAGCHDKPIIILRTGQPGLLKDSEILQNKNIDAVVEKSAITRSSFIELLTRMLQGSLNKSTTPDGKQ